MLLTALISLATFVAGVVVACLFLRARTVGLKERLLARDSELNHARAANGVLNADVRQMRQELQDACALQASAESLSSALKLDVDALKQDQVRTRGELTKMTSQLAESEARREEESKAIQGKVLLLTDAKEEFRSQFQILAADILEDKSKRFTEHNQLVLSSLLNPLSEQIGEFKKRVEETYDKESQQRTSLRDSIESLRGLNQKMNEDALNLTNALKGQSKTLGNWGEFVLEEILEKAGLIKDREYSVRETLIAEDGRRSQPDVLITLPEERHLVIDSKINLSSYLRHCSSENEADGELELKNHIAGIRRHIRDLDLRSYQDHYRLNTLDFVLMFIPLEPAFIVAVRRDPTLFDDAFAKRIVIVCPSTLLATMRTVRNIWRQEQQKRNVLEIAKQSGALYDKFVGFVEDINQIGMRLKQTQDVYDAAHNKLTSGKGNLVSRAEQIVKLGAKASKRLPLALFENDSANEANGVQLIEEATDSFAFNDDDLLAATPDDSVVPNGNTPLLNSKIAGAGDG